MLVYLCIYFIFIIRVGSACSHVEAVLFKLQACVQLGMNKKAYTSKPCQWNVSRRKVDPVPLQQMSIKCLRKGNLTEILDPFEDPKPFSFKDPLLNNVSEKRKRKIAELQSIAHKGVVFTSISKFVPEKIDNSDTDTLTKMRQTHYLSL